MKQAAKRTTKLLVLGADIFGVAYIFKSVSACVCMSACMCVGVHESVGMCKPVHARTHAPDLRHVFFKNQIVKLAS